MRRLFANPLGACAPPQAPIEKRIWPAIIAAAGALGGAAINAVSSSKADESRVEAQRLANEANMQINGSQLAAARENWAREQQNFILQRKWNLQDRADERSYNSPQNMRDLYLRAGINPALAMNGGSSVGSVGVSTKQAQAPSFGSPPSSIPMQAPDIHGTDYSGFGVAFQNAADLYYKAEMNEAQIAVMREHSRNETLDTLSKISNRDWSNKQIKAAIDRMVYDLEFSKDTEGLRKDNLKFINDSILADTAYKNMQTSLAEIQKQFNIDANNRAWTELSQFLKESASRISLNASQAHKNYQDAATSFQQELKGIFDNSKIEEIYNNNKAQANLMLQKLKYETSVQGFKDFIKLFQGFIPLGGMW